MPGQDTDFLGAWQHWGKRELGWDLGTEKATGKGYARIKRKTGCKAEREVPKLASKKSQHQDTGRTLSVVMNAFLLHSEKCQVPLLGWEKQQGFQRAGGLPARVRRRPGKR